MPHQPDNTLPSSIEQIPADRRAEAAAIVARNYLDADDPHAATEAMRILNLSLTEWVDNESELVDAATIRAGDRIVADDYSEFVEVLYDARPIPTAPDMVNVAVAHADISRHYKADDQVLILRRVAS